MVYRLGFWAFTAMAQVQTLVRELRSCKLHSTVKKKERVLVIKVIEYLPRKR